MDIIEFIARTKAKAPGRIYSPNTSASKPVTHVQPSLLPARQLQSEFI